MSNDVQDFYEFEDFRLDAIRGVLFRRGEVVDITPKAVDILRLLVEKRGELVSKEEIFEKVWPDSFVEEANLTHHISKLRKALGETDGRKLIETLPKRGYRFIAPLKETAGSTRTSPRAAGSRWMIGLGVVILVIVSAGGWLWVSRRSYREQAREANPTFSSLAVLPFVNESGDEDLEYIADGLTESLIGRLSEASLLRVRPYSAVARYKGTNGANEAAGAQLKVDFILSGRVTKRGESVRLFLSLVDVASGYQTWGKQYDADNRSLVGLQSDVLREVSDYLPGKLSELDKERVLAGAPRNSEAYVLYLKGRYQLNRKTVDGIRKAIDHFNEAASLDPTYALAYSGIADAYNQMGLWVTMPPGDTFPKAKAAAQRALSLDDRLAEARTSLGWAKLYYDWDFAGAEAEYKQSIRQNPNYTFARESYAVLIYETQPARFEEAMQHLNAASEIDPVASSVYFWRGAFYYFQGRHDDALRELQEAQDIDPNYTLGRALKGAVYREKGEFDKYLDNWLNASPLEGVDLSASEIEMLRSVYRSKGLKSYEIAYAELLQGRSKERYVSPVFVAMHYSLAGETDLAIEWLEKAFAERSSWLVELKVDPAWKNLHADSRYQNLLKRIGFPQ
ncbi:MAG TPA: winged helix-turn-helix domain-containing protein [Pyrinomonadaceae bacterium]|nr:winged helix-turn-helix domain-containing protein [Pyrinomonadaceae bacterium]